MHSSESVFVFADSRQHTLDIPVQPFCAASCPQRRLSRRPCSPLYRPIFASTGRAPWDGDEWKVFQFCVLVVGRLARGRAMTCLLGIGTCTTKGTGLNQIRKHMDGAELLLQDAFALQCLGGSNHSGCKFRGWPAGTTAEQRERDPEPPIPEEYAERLKQECVYDRAWIHLPRDLGTIHELDLCRLVDGRHEVGVRRKHDYPHTVFLTSAVHFVWPYAGTPALTYAAVADVGHAGELDKRYPSTVDQVCEVEQVLMQQAVPVVIFAPANESVWAEQPEVPDGEMATFVAASLEAYDAMETIWKDHSESSPSPATCGGCKRRLRPLPYVKEAVVQTMRLAF
jgi:hypothetical protein